MIHFCHVIAQSLLATIFIPTAGGLGGGVVVCITVLMTITVIAIIKRYATPINMGRYDQ